MTYGDLTTSVNRQLLTSAFDRSHLCWPGQDRCGNRRGDPGESV